MYLGQGQSKRYVKANMTDIGETCRVLMANKWQNSWFSLHFFSQTMISELILRFEQNGLWLTCSCNTFFQNSPSFLLSNAQHTIKEKKNNRNRWNDYNYQNRILFNNVHPHFFSERKMAAKKTIDVNDSVIRIGNHEA